MILPQYSLRKLLAITVGAALFCLVVSWGVQGNRWAFGISIAGLSLIVALLVQGLVFWLVWLLASLAVGLRATRNARPTKPHAAQPVAANVSASIGDHE